MSRFRSVIVCMVACWILTAHATTGEEKPATKSKPALNNVLPLRTGQAEIEKALREPTKLEFDETPLTDVVDDLRDRHRVEIQIDSKALDEAGIGEDSPITKNLKGVSLRSALSLILRGLGLTWTVHNDVVWITTPEQERCLMFPRIYDVPDLVVCRDENGRLRDDYMTLIRAIEDAVDPHSWGGSGGPGTIVDTGVGKSKLLVVFQTYKIHGEIAELLATVREIGEKSSDADRPCRDKPSSNASGMRAATAAIEKVLAKPVQLEFDEIPLTEAIDDLKERLHVEIQLDMRALDKAGIGADTPVTATLNGVSLRSALNLVLGNIDLTWMVHDEVLLITTPDGENDLWQTEVYDVSDLIALRSEHGQPADDYFPLIDMISCMVSPSKWSCDRSDPIVGVTLGNAKVVMVRQAHSVHEELAKLLAGIREAAKASSNAEAPRRDKLQSQDRARGRMRGHRTSARAPRSNRDGTMLPMKSSAEG